MLRPRKPATTIICVSTRPGSRPPFLNETPCGGGGWGGGGGVGGGGGGGWGGGGGDGARQCERLQANRPLLWDTEYARDRRLNDARG